MFKRLDVVGLPLHHDTNRDTREMARCFGGIITRLFVYRVQETACDEIEQRKTALAVLYTRRRKRSSTMGRLALNSVTPDKLPSLRGSQLVDKMP